MTGNKDNPDGHHVGKSHLRKGPGSWTYERDPEVERGINEEVPKGMRHGKGAPQQR